MQQDAPASEAPPVATSDTAVDTAARCARSWAEIEAAARAVGARATASWLELEAAARSAGERAARR